MVMGGCGNAHGNASPTTEFNTRADPEGADEVFAALARPPGEEQLVSPLHDLESCTILAGLGSTWVVFRGVIEGCGTR